MDLTHDAPAVACVRCRKQKLRCSRERPVCQRCHRAGKQCSYPQPPDRKRLALERALERSSSAAVQVQQPSPILQDSGPSSAPCPHPEPEPESAGRVTLGNASPIHVSAEVALYLFEIHFERHYQADLLFRKRQFITNYQSGASCPYVVLAVLAFASIFLPSTPGGISQGKIDILDLSVADWKAISQQWAEQASEQALGRADRPCLEVVQACQVLAMFWFAKGETKRTNVHTAIAYRASRLLHLDHVDETGWSAHKELGLRCFWACWLTRCASQENSRFPGDCWAEVAGRLLPVDADDVATNSHACYLDEKGGIVYPDRESSVGFSSVLILVQGLWWEVQNFALSIRGSRGTPSDWAQQYCILDKKLEDLPIQLPGWDWGSAGRGTTGPTPEEPSRMFSLGYLFELCNLYLHSSVVPVFSCLGQTRILSQPMLQLAAERAWEHSLKLTAMTEHHLSRQSPISKLWPMIGYGAYVCAAVQLRRCLALQLLDEQALGRARVHLQFTGGLMRYWTTLRPLHEDMERQFAQAEVLSRTPQEDAPASVPARAGDTQSPFDTRDPALSAELTSSIPAYVADDDGVENSGATTGPRGEHSEMTSKELPRRISGHPGAVRPEGGHRTTPEREMFDSADRSPGDLPWGAQPPPPAQVWWNQDSGSLGEAFGSGSFWPEDLGFLMDIA